MAPHAVPMADLSAARVTVTPFDSTFTPGDAAAGVIAVPETLEERMGLGKTLAERIGAAGSLAEQMGLVVVGQPEAAASSLVWTPDTVNWK